MYLMGTFLTFQTQNFMPKSCDFMHTTEQRVARFPLFIVRICCGIVGNKPNFGSADHSACAVYTKTIIPLSVSASGGYLVPLQ